MGTGEQMVHLTVVENARSFLQIRTQTEENRNHQHKKYTVVKGFTGTVLPREKPDLTRPMLNFQALNDHIYSANESKAGPKTTMKQTEFAQQKDDSWNQVRSSSNLCSSSRHFPELSLELTFAVLSQGNTQN